MNQSRFDKAAYLISNNRIISLIKETLDWEKTEGFIADGVICPDEYEKQPFRILCILAESYGYDGCGVTSIEDQFNKDVLGLANKKVKTPRKLSTLLWLLQNSTERESKITWDEFPSLFTIKKEYTDLLQKTLSKVAWINVKKASRHKGTTMVNDEVFAHALRNQVVLREQIEVAAPHLIIICGKVVFRALHEMKLLGPEVVSGQIWQIQTVKNSPRVLEVSHPRNWWGYQKLYTNFESIYGQIA